MNVLIIVKSVHHDNTRKVAEAMASVLDAKVVIPADVDLNELSGYDLIGMGSGIYFGRHHRSLLKLAERMSGFKGKVFIFSTAGLPFKMNHRALRERLKNSGLSINGEFVCKGWDSYGILNVVGGIWKGNPDEKDLENAREFARSLK